MFEIERGIPIPRKGRGPSTEYQGRYPFRDMAIGDSFVVPCGEPFQHITQISVHNSAKAYSARWSPDDPVRIATAGEPNGVRVWRVR